MTVIFDQFPDIYNVLYTTGEYDTIEVLFYKNGISDSDFPSTMSHVIPATDPTNKDLIYLQEKGWDFDRILENTIEWNRSQAEAYKQIWAYSAQETIDNLKEEYEAKINTLRDSAYSSGHDLLIGVMDKNNDPDILSDAKLEAFEFERVAAADNEFKAQVRNAPTLIQLLALIENYGNAEE